MVVTHEIKFPLGHQYEMRSMVFQADTSEFPELVGQPPTKQLRYVQGVLMQQALMFKVASGYFTTQDADFKAAWAAASELKGVLVDTVGGSRG